MRANMASWIVDGQRNTFLGIINYHHKKDGYKLVADWRGLPFAIAEIERLQVWQGWGGMGWDGVASHLPMHTICAATRMLMLILT